MTGIAAANATGCFNTALFCATATGWTTARGVLLRGGGPSENSFRGRAGVGAGVGIGAEIVVGAEAGVGAGAGADGRLGVGGLKVGTGPCAGRGTGTGTGGADMLVPRSADEIAAVGDRGERSAVEPTLGIFSANPFRLSSSLIAS